MTTQLARPPIPVLSFFSGAGFMDIGFKQAGFDVVWHNEFYEEFARGFYYGMTQLYGHPPAEPKVASIDDLLTMEIIKEAFGSRYTPEVFGMIGGPPCPDFSVGGKNRGFEGENGRLSQIYVNKIEELQPTFFVFENVKGLFRTAKHREHLNRLVRQLEPFYYTDIKVLNALEYGVPQDRERVFFVGIKKKWLKANDKVPNLTLPQLAGKEHWFPFPVPPAEYQDAKVRFCWPTTSVFRGEPEPPDSRIPPELMAGTYILDQSDLAKLENSDHFFEPYSDKFETIAEGDVEKKSFKRLHRHRYSPTAAYGNNEVHLHPTLARRLSVREAMRIQSVPDGYALPKDMTLSDMFKTVGNGVPVKLAEAVASAFMKFLQE